MKYFTIKELVSPDIYSVLSEEACWRLIPQIVQTNLDALRKEFNSPIIINDGKTLVNCGIRSKMCEVGAVNSRHKLYDSNITAFDLHAKDLTKLVDLVKTNYKKFGICSIEDTAYTKSWLHVEFSHIKVTSQLKVFKP